MLIRSISSRVTELTDSKVEFGLIPRDHWFQPDSIDEEKATAARQSMVKNNVIYGGTFCVCCVFHMIVMQLLQEVYRMYHTESPFESSDFYV